MNTGRTVPPHCVHKVITTKCTIWMVCGCYDDPRVWGGWSWHCRPWTRLHCRPLRLLHVMQACLCMFLYVLCVLCVCVVEGKVQSMFILRKFCFMYALADCRHILKLMSCENVSFETAFLPATVAVDWLWHVFAFSMCAAFVKSRSLWSSLVIVTSFRSCGTWFQTLLGGDTGSCFFSSCPRIEFRIVIGPEVWDYDRPVLSLHSGHACGTLFQTLCCNKHSRTKMCWKICSLFLCLYLDLPQALISARIHSGWNFCLFPGFTPLTQIYAFWTQSEIRHDLWTSRGENDIVSKYGKNTPVSRKLTPLWPKNAPLRISLQTH